MGSTTSSTLSTPLMSGAEPSARLYAKQPFEAGPAKVRIQKQNAAALAAPVPVLSSH